MQKSRFAGSQMLALMAEGGAGIPVAEAFRKQGISNATYHQ